MTRSYSTATKKHDSNENSRSSSLEKDKTTDNKHETKLGNKKTTTTAPQLENHRNLALQQSAVKDNEMKKQDEKTEEAVPFIDLNLIAELNHKSTDTKSQASSRVSGTVLDDSHDIIAKKREQHDVIYKQRKNTSSQSKKFKTDANQFFKQYTPKFRGYDYSEGLQKISFSNKNKIVRNAQDRVQFET